MWADFSTDAEKVAPVVTDGMRAACLHGNDAACDEIEAVRSPPAPTRPIVHLYLSGAKQVKVYEVATTTCRLSTDPFLINPCSAF